MLSTVNYLDADGEMVRCGNMQCPLGAWFHIDCVGLESLPAVDEDWWCSDECRSSTNGNSSWFTAYEDRPDCSTDYLRQYTLALTFYSLMDLCQKDAIREGDGLAMMSFWRINMLRFWRGNHYKYLKIGHRLLAGLVFNQLHIFSS